MNWLQKLNPMNSLFSRIFLWFWLVIVLIVASSIWLATNIDNEGKIVRAPLHHQQKLLHIARQMQKAGRRANRELDPQQVINVAQRRMKKALLLFAPQQQKFYYAMQEQHRPSQAQVLKLSQVQRVAAMALTPHLLVGPASLELDGEDYQLFMLRRLNPSLITQLRQQHPGLLLFIALSVSALLCSLLAWSLVKPIRKLQQASREMAAGDLTTRVAGLEQRRDEIGQLAREFNQMSTQVESLMLGQKRLLADISHELRTPLARLNLVIGIAQDDQQIQNSHLQRIEKEAQLIESMVAQILRLSRLESQSLEINKTQVNLQSILDPLLEDGRYEAKGCDKQLQADSYADVQLFADPALLSSAIENVLRNAIKYAQSTVWLTVEQQARVLEICIEDDGPGLEQAELEKIFTPFYRVSSARNRANGGIGLGLAISNQALLAHDAQIQAFNRSPNGLKVTILLPIDTV